ncbi:MAG: FAD-dependent oxidoreductase [Chitinophagaceae bacterium]
MKRDGACKSLWQSTADDYVSGENKVDQQTFDVIIAGGGITGLTTGLLLQKAGKSVLIAEAKSIGFGTTGGTTAHLNTMMDTPYATMEKNFGENNTQTVAKSIQAALRLIRETVEGYNIDCSYQQSMAYLYSKDEKQSKELETVYSGSEKYKVDVAYVNDIPAPFPYNKVIRFGGQARFHPLRYLAGLAKAFEEAGGVLLEDCRVTAVDELENEYDITSGMGRFKCTHFIYATHIPPGVNLLHFRCAPYRSYALAIKLKNENDYPDAMIYDMDDPYHYYRTQEIDGQKYLIAGGEDHKTGHEENTQACFRKLEAYVRNYYDIDKVTHRWSSQYFEPVDGLPYIGHLPGHTGNMYVATGFGGNGMIYSAVAAMELTQLITTGKSEFEEVFNPNRIKPVAGFANFVKEAADVTGKLIKKVLPAEKLTELTDLAPGEARVVKYEDQRLAIYKDEKGRVYALNSACTHIKCDVSWNNAEKTWDCPCHGSRFSYTGEVLTAPARKEMQVVGIAETVGQK